MKQSHPFFLFLSLSFFQETKNEEPLYINNKDWIVILTTCVNHINAKNENNVEKRKELYIKQIKKWLYQTDYFIVVVESSGYNFPDLVDNSMNKLAIFSFQQDTNNVSSSSVLEKKSLEFAMNRLYNMPEYQDCNYILKVTGKYYLNGIEKELEKYNGKNIDVFLQTLGDEKTRNSEYFGMKKQLFLDLHAYQD